MLALISSAVVPATFLAYIWLVTINLSQVQRARFLEVHEEGGDDIAQQLPPHAKLKNVLVRVDSQAPSLLVALEGKH